MTAADNAPDFPTTAIRGSAMVASADHRATQAGVDMLKQGGNAVDAAIATNAVMAVCAPHMCGLGGDLWALVHHNGEVHCLNASGRSGSGADSQSLRQEGLTAMPFLLDIRSVTIPGCVDGWLALHARFGSLPLQVLFGPAIEYATNGHAASPLLVGALRTESRQIRTNLRELSEQATNTGAVVKRPGVGRTLQAIIAGGRDAFYLDEFGKGLVRVGQGLFDLADMNASQAEWVEPLTGFAFGVQLYTAPPNSQGYLTIGSAELATQLAMPDATDATDPTGGTRTTDATHDTDGTNSPAWAHLLIEAATAAAFDRPDVLSDRANGRQLLTEIAKRFATIDPNRATNPGQPIPSQSGDTTYLCTADAAGMAVSLIQSNAAGFGSGLVEPNTQINLHNRGMGFSLVQGHPAEYLPSRRPPHTLSPAMATRDNTFVAAFGTMGGDAQPQILLQLASRMFGYNQDPAHAINAPRWILNGPSTGFDTWSGAPPTVLIEGHANPEWLTTLAKMGHRVATAPQFDHNFGHAHAIVVDPDGQLRGAADPRTSIGMAAGI